MLLGFPCPLWGRVLLAPSFSCAHHAERLRPGGRSRASQSGGAKPWKQLLLGAVFVPRENFLFFPLPRLPEGRPCLATCILLLWKTLPHVVYPGGPGWAEALRAGSSLDRPAAVPWGGGVLGSAGRSLPQATQPALQASGLVSGHPEVPRRRSDPPRGSPVRAGGGEAAVALSRTCWRRREAPQAESAACGSCVHQRARRARRTPEAQGGASDPSAGGRNGLPLPLGPASARAAGRCCSAGWTWHGVGLVGRWEPRVSRACTGFPFLPAWGGGRVWGGGLPAASLFQCLSV